MQNWFAFFLISLFFNRPLVAGDFTSAPIGCQEPNANTGRFLLESSAILNRDLIPGNEAELDAFIDEAIERQVMHLMGYLKNTLKATLLPQRKLIEKKISKDLYGSRFFIDRYLPKNRGEEKNPYIRASFSKKEITPQDEALVINYKMELLIADCTGQGIMKEKLPVVLPRDPYLSFWIEKKQLRQKRRLGPFELDEISSCSSDELIVYGNADDSWYFWSPFTKEGKSCVSLEDPSVVIPKISQIEKVAPPPILTKDFFFKKKIRAAFIFGEVDTSSYYTPKDIGLVEKAARKNINHCLRNKKASCKNEWNPYLGSQKDGKYFEPGVHSFMVFLKHLNEFMEIKSFRPKANESEIILTLEGELRSLKKALVIDVYFGNTQLQSPVAPTKAYLSFLYEAFREADTVSYVGHAGLGKNLKIEEITKRWKESGLTPFQRKNPLWLGIYNCEAASYFGNDLNLLFEKGQMRVIETLTSGTNSGAEFPLFHLKVIQELSLRGQSKISDHLKLNPKYPDEFVVYSRIEE